MNIEEGDDYVVVKLENTTVTYGLDKMTESNYLTSNGVIRLEEWKIDLIKNHGVDLNELQG